MNSLKYPFSNVQVELMKLFSTDFSDKELVELKDLLLGFTLKKPFIGLISCGMKKA